MNQLPPDELVLEFGKARAKVSSLSASITFLEIDGVMAIEQLSRQAIEGAYASAVCAPWPNRIAGGLWNGRKIRANDSHGNALHGLVFDKEFSLVQHDESSASYVYDLYPSEFYPFHLQIGADYSLGNSGISCRYWAVNKGADTAPYGVAAHPYISIIDDSIFFIPARSQALNDDKQIPTHFSGIAGSELRTFSDSQLDDCFTELAGEVEIRHSNGSVVRVWQDDEFPYLMVFTAHNLSGFGLAKPGLAIEPQTCPANAFNSGDHLIWLSPGESWQGSWGISATAGGRKI